MMTLSEWTDWMLRYCDGNAFDPDSLKELVAGWSDDRRRQFRLRFEWILSNKPISREEWMEKTNLWYEDEREFHQDFLDIYNIIFRNE